MKQLLLLLAGYSALTSAPEERKAELKDIFGTPSAERIAQHSSYSDLSSLATASKSTQHEIMEIPLVKHKKGLIEGRQKIVTHIANKLRIMLDGLGRWDPLPRLTVSDSDAIRSMISEYASSYGDSFLSAAEEITVGPLTFADRHDLHTVPGRTELQSRYLRREFTLRVMRLEESIVILTTDQQHIAGCMLHGYSHPFNEHGRTGVVVPLNTTNLTICYLLPRILDLLPLWEGGCNYEVKDIIEVLKPCFTSLIEVGRDAPEAVAVLIHRDVARRALGLSHHSS